MSKHLQTGIKGEKVASDFLQKNGYVLRALNWRYSRAEVDIIAEKEGMIVFAEVKTRTNDFTLPEVAVNSKKQKLLAKAASAYLYEINHRGEFRFDVISVYLMSEKDIRIEHLQDAFFPGLA